MAGWQPTLGQSASSGHLLGGSVAAATADMAHQVAAHTFYQKSRPSAQQKLRGDLFQSGTERALSPNPKPILEEIRGLLRTTHAQPKLRGFSALQIVNSRRSPTTSKDTSRQTIRDNECTTKSIQIDYPEFPGMGQKTVCSEVRGIVVQERFQE